MAKKGGIVLVWKGKRITPAQIILLGFLCIILLGTVLLMLPFSTKNWGGAPFLDALFTATSATCVTGLVLHDTMQYWSGFGQFVILSLIQIGGMGVVTMAIAITLFAGRKIGLKQRWVMQESISAPQVGGIVRLTSFILKTALLIEGVGAILLATQFCPELGLLKGIWYGIFHSVSAFCNAGFDLMGAHGAFSSLTPYTGNLVINFTVMLLIILGGIGFITWSDIWEHKLKFRTYRLQSKLILTMTAGLLLLPFLFLFFYEFSLPQWEGMGLKERIIASMFQAVTPRTAGFNSVDLTKLSEPSQMMVSILMLIGGSPGSTAGGFKTTTLAVFILSAVAVYRKRDSVQAFGRRLTPDVLRSAVSIFFLYFVLFCMGGLSICCIEQIPLSTALFEAASAIGTVGLSLGLTPGLSIPSQLILIFLMYFGRVGGLTLIYAVMSRSGHTLAQLPQEKVTVG